jgi:putative ABC transport system permease protein
MRNTRRSIPPARAILQMGREGLGRYPLRSALSTLGIVVGIASVLAMLSVSEGGRREILAQVERFGLDNIIVRSQPNPALRLPGLTVGDADRLQRGTSSAVAVASVVRRIARVSGPLASRAAPVTAAGPGYPRIARLPVVAGRALGPLDSEARRCVIGRRLAVDLFGSASPLGAVVRVDDDYFDVVGVGGERGARGQTDDRDLPDVENGVVVPLASVLRRSPDLDPGQRVEQIWVRTDRPKNVIEEGDLVRRSLARFHDGANDFDVLVPRSLLDQRLRAQHTFDVIAGTVAALALLVGGIGVMNVMLASVTARTEEIGLRRAVGATRRGIVVQFLAESALMSAGGGVVGLAAGAALARAITAVAGWPTLVSLPAGVLALIVSLAVGLGFGVYPALRAARLDPIDAVRHE